MPRLIPRPSGYCRCPVGTGCTSASRSSSSSGRRKLSDSWITSLIDSSFCSALDDRGRLLRAGDHAFCKRPDSFKIRLVPRQPTQAGFAIRNDRRKRLVDFMRDRGRQHAKARDPRHVRELGVPILQFLGPSANLCLETIGQFAQLCFRPFARGDFRFELLDRLNRLVRGGREATHAFEQPEILGVEFSIIAVGDRPNRTGRLAVHVKRNKQQEADRLRRLSVAG